MLHKIYVEELHRSLGYLAAWFPTQELRLGDIVMAGDSGLVPVGSLKDHGLSFTNRVAHSQAVYEYASSGAVSVSAKFAGQLLPGSALANGEAGLLVKFNRENAILFEASGCTGKMIADVASLGRAIEKLYAANAWERSWLVVTEIVSAAAATVIISGSRTAQADLKANGSIKQGSTKLSDVEAKFEAKNTVDIGFKIIASSSLTPLYRAAGVKLTWTGGGRFQPRSSTKREAQSTAFSTLKPDDLFIN